MILLIIAFVVVLISMGIVLTRGALGPRSWDRVLAANAFGSNTVIAVLLLTFIFGNMQFIDIALIYALINFITTTALLKFFTSGHFGDHFDDDEQAFFTPGETS